MSNTNFPNGVSVGGYVDFVDVTITVAAENTNVINVDIDALDATGDNVDRAVSFIAWVSDTAATDIAGTVPDTVAAGTNGSVAALITSGLLVVTTDSSGNVDIDITEDGADTWYLNILLPNGRVESSGAITFTT